MFLGTNHERQNGQENILPPFLPSFYTDKGLKCKNCCLEKRFAVIPFYIWTTFEKWSKHHISLKRSRLYLIQSQCCVLPDLQFSWGDKVSDQGGHSSTFSKCSPVSRPVTKSMCTNTYLPSALSFKRKDNCLILKHVIILSFQRELCWKEFKCTLWKFKQP